MWIELLYSVFHRILDLKTGVYFYTAPFSLKLPIIDTFRPVAKIIIVVLIIVLIKDPGFYSFF